MNLLKLTLISLSAAVAAVALGLGGDSGPFGLERAEAGKRCSGSKDSPKRVKVVQAQRTVICLINKRRASHNRGRLRAKKTVTKAATAHTRHMQRRDCFSHQCQGEPDLAGRLKRSDYLPCRCSWSVRENIAWGKGRGSGSPAKIVRGWMKSSVHRSTLLDRRLQHVGVGFRRGSPYSKTRKAGTYTANFGYKR